LLRKALIRAKKRRQQPERYVQCQLYCFKVIINLNSLTSVEKILYIKKHGDFMPNNIDFVKYVMEKINFEIKTFNEMNGQYMICINDKPVLFIWNNIVYLKKINEIEHFFENEKTIRMVFGDCYIIDIDNCKYFNEIVKIIEDKTEVPTKKYELNNLQEIEYKPYNPQSYYHGFKINKDGVWLYGKLIQYSQIINVVYQKIEPKKHGLGGWVKIVTEDNSLLPEFNGDDFVVPGSNRPRVDNRDNCIVFNALSEDECIINNSKILTICSAISSIIHVNYKKNIKIINNEM
jgi:hypothetical protein